jgi:hypothetical protein
VHIVLSIIARTSRLVAYGDPHGILVDGPINRYGKTTDAA